MNLQTYLMIKSAYYDGMEKDAFKVKNKADWDKKMKKKMPGYGMPGNKPVTKENAPETFSASTATPIPASLITSESVSSPMYTDSVNVNDAFNSDSTISDTEKQLADANNMLDLYRKADLSNARAQATMLGGTVGGIGGLYLGNKGTKWLNKKLGLTADRGGWRKWLGRGTRLVGTVGSGIGGAYLGGKLGHMGASYGQKRLADRYFNGDQNLMADVGAATRAALGEVAGM